MGLASLGILRTMSRLARCRGAVPRRGSAGHPCPAGRGPFPVGRGSLPGGRGSFPAGRGSLPAVACNRRSGSLRRSGRAAIANPVRTGLHGPTDAASAARKRHDELAPPATDAGETGSGRGLDGPGGAQLALEGRGRRRRLAPKWNPWRSRRRSPCRTPSVSASWTPSAIVRFSAKRCSQSNAPKPPSCP